MLQVDLKDLDASVSEYQRRQTKLIVAVAWMLTQQKLPISPAAALKALGLKPTAKLVSLVESFEEAEDLEK